MKKVIAFIIFICIAGLSYSQTNYPEDEIIQNLPTGVSYQSGPGANNEIKQWTYPYGTKLSIIKWPNRSFEITSTTYPDGDLAFRQWDVTNNEWRPWRKILMENYNGGLTNLTLNNTGDGAVLLDFQTERNWQFRQFSSGAYTALELKSVGGGGNKHFLINTGGNVGIGTTDTFGYKLAVNGTIGTKEVNVEVSSDWPDYVFNKDYALPTLAEVEAHIKANGHLKDIPSEAEVKENGIQLGEMDAKLLQKIEELTLYVIDLKKQVDELKQQTKN